MPDRKVLTQISQLSWEHPADRAALNTLRAIPGFDEVVKKVAGFFGERGVRHLFLADAVRIGPRQRPKLWGLYQEVLETMDWPDHPQLYVTQTPMVNAGAVGFDRPFIIMNSGTLGLLDREERRTILGHELGHIMSGHMVYRTIALIILSIGSVALFPIGLALLPFQLALLEWHRKSELSSDRAALLAVQDHLAAQGTFMRLAGGRDFGDASSVDAFMRQAVAYETGGDTWDRILKLINTAFREHPFNTVRAGELERWRLDGAYASILAANYTRRGESGQGLGADYSDAARYYSGKSTSARTGMTDAYNRARDAFNDAFRGPGDVPPTGPTVDPMPPV